MHPLKFFALLSVAVLFLTQWLLPWMIDNEMRLWIAAALSLPLLFPLVGMLRDRLYTYKWTGFLALLYFLIGVSEAFSTEALRLYGVINLVASQLLFFTSVYYTRFLRQSKP